MQDKLDMAENKY